jgi:hypothetical protein
MTGVMTEMSELAANLFVYSHIHSMARAQSRPRYEWTCFGIAAVRILSEVRRAAGRLSLEVRPAPRITKTPVAPPLGSF